MKYQTSRRTVAICATAALIAACGGGGSAPSNPLGTVVLSGTAATGLALSSAGVHAKCSSGTGTAFTDVNGAYTVSVSGGALPCMVEVEAVVAGNVVRLHSIAEAGTASGATTTVRTNVTPLTELIVAALLGNKPDIAYSSFGAAPITSQQLATATGTVLAAVRNALGVDLGTIDPFKSDLVPATSSAPNAGNAHDKALDALAAKINTQSLPLLIAHMVGSGGSTASAISQSLLTGPGCPSATSGRYRTIGLTGDVATAQFDFKTMTATFDDGHNGYSTIQPNPLQACDFSLGGIAYSDDASYRFAIGSQGAGAFSSRETWGGRAQGYLVPVQSATTLADAAGTWTVAQSGVDGSASNPRVNRFSRLTISATGSLTACDYDPAKNWAGVCAGDSGTADLQLVSGIDGSLELRSGADAVARLWAFRSPAGGTTFFGTSNLGAASVVKTSIVMASQQALALPSVGTVTKTLNFQTVSGTQFGTTFSGNLFLTRYTVQSVDVVGSSYVRGGTSGGVAVANQVVGINAPQTGLRTISPITAQAQMPIPDAGLYVLLGVSAPTSYNHVISVTMPQ